MYKKIRIILPIFFVCLAVMTTCVYHLTQQADINYYQGHRLFLNGRYADAIPYFEKSLTFNPSYKKTLRELAYSYLWASQPERSIELLHKITCDDVENYQDRISLARAYSWTGKYKDAVSLFEDILRRRDDMAAKKGLAEVYVWSGQPEKAVLLLKNIVKTSPQDLNARFLYAKSLYYSGQPQEASVLLEELLRKEGGLPKSVKTGELVELLAEVYVAAGRHKEAVEFYKGLLHRAPGNKEARVQLAQLLSWQKEYMAAATEYMKVLEAYPGDIPVIKKLAEVYVWQGDFDKARLLYEGILKKDPDDKEVYMLLGEVLVWEKKYEEAIKYYLMAVKDIGQAQLAYGQAFLYSGQYQLAQHVFEEILKKQPDHLKARMYLADTYAYSGRYQKAIASYKDILRQQKDLSVKEKLADALSWDKRYDESVKLYDEILQQEYRFMIHRQKARVLGWARRYDEAEKEYRKILDKKYDEITEIEMRAKIAYWNGRDAAAITAYKNVIDLEPDNTEAMFDLSQVYSYNSMWTEAIEEYKRVLKILPSLFRAQEGLQKARLMAECPFLKTQYRFYEADSPSRDTDIHKHQALNKAGFPIYKKTNLEVEYNYTHRSFADFNDLTEQEGHVKLVYVDNPDWHASGYYGLISYNQHLDKQMHLFGMNFARRVGGCAFFNVEYDRQRLENNSDVIRRFFHRNLFKGRLSVNTSKRLKWGLDYSSAYYSDNNIMREPAADIMYYFSFEPVRFYVKYRYFYRAFENTAREYFSLKKFFTNTLTLSLRHYLNKEEIFFGADDIYYDVNYNCSVDSENIVGHKFSLELNWDINKRLNFNVKGSVMHSSANVYSEKEAVAALKYYF